MDSNVYMQEMVKRAYRFALKAHEGQLDKGGKPYIDHVMYVASKFIDSSELRIVAMLHDVVEDTKYSIEDIESEGFDKCIIDALRVITKPDDMDYMDYIERISFNELASRVKIEDLKHNMDITRISNPTDYDFKRVKKYKKALEYLEKKYGEERI